MTPEATEILYMLNTVQRTDTQEAQQSLKKLSASLNAIVDIFEELLYSDKKLLEDMFVMNWIDSEKYKIIGRYLNVNPINIMCSPDKLEIIRMSAEMITCEALSEIFKFVEPACGITLKEFALAWRILNESGEMRDILFGASIETDNLLPQVKVVYLSYLKDKEADERIHGLIKNDYLEGK